MEKDQDKKVDQEEIEEPKASEELNEDELDGVAGGISIRQLPRTGQPLPPEQWKR